MNTMIIDITWYDHGRNHDNHVHDTIGLLIIKPTISRVKWSAIAAQPRFEDRFAFLLGAIEDSPREVLQIDGKQQENHLSMVIHSDS